MAEPGRLPSGAGPVPMPRDLHLSIAQITIAVASEDASLELDVAGPTEKFLTGAEPAETRLTAGWGELEASVRGRRLFDSGGLWRLYEADGGYRFDFTSAAIGASPYKRAWLDSSFAAGQVLLDRRRFDPRRAHYPLEYPLDELLVVGLLAQGRGVEIHGCGLVDCDGRGYLFAGSSGAGKTTMARLWQEQAGVRILSDDRIIVRQVCGRLWMYGTPWHGDAELAENTGHPLESIFLLGRGRENAVIEQRPPLAAARLFSCSFPPFYLRDGLEFTLGFLGQAVNTVPVYELRFVPDPGVIAFVRAHRSRA